MAIPSFDIPKEGSFAISKLFPLDGRLNFQNSFHIFNMVLSLPLQR
jgi:hypothetical protein